MTYYDTLVTDCRFSLAPSGHQLPQTTSVYFDDHLNQTDLIVKDSFSNSIVVVAAYSGVDEEAMHPISSCHIESLEIYRGTQRITKISHNGFTITDNKMIEVGVILVLQHK